MHVLLGSVKTLRHKKLFLQSQKTKTDSNGSFSSLSTYLSSSGSKLHTLNDNICTCYVWWDDRNFENTISEYNTFLQAQLFSQCRSTCYSSSSNEIMSKKEHVGMNPLL